MNLWFLWSASLMVVAFVLPAMVGAGAVLFHIFKPDTDSARRKSEEELVAESRTRRQAAESTSPYAQRLADIAPPSLHWLELPSPEPEPGIE